MKTRNRAFQEVVVIKQPCDRRRIILQSCNDFRYIRWRNFGVKYALRFNDHQGAPLTKAMTTGVFDLQISAEVTPSDLGFQGCLNKLRATGDTTGALADQ